MPNFPIRWACSAFFFISGFCGLLYQVVWMRLAFAHFGINTPVLSIVLSVFMAGLALGSWLGGRLSESWLKKDGALALRCYGAVEWLTGFGAFLVPHLFTWGGLLLLPLGGVDSGPYLFASAAVLLFSLLPWCFFMGTTFPLMTAYLKTLYDSREGFSFLYTSNVLGAMAGVLMTAVVLIECLGFQGTLLLGAGLNSLVGLRAFWLSWKNPQASSPHPTGPSPSIPMPGTESPVPYLPLLFTTGFVSMGLEVVWNRAYTFLMSTSVYAFACLLFAYLLATFLGSGLYRWHLKRGFSFSTPPLLGAAFAFSFLPSLLNDPRLHPGFFRPLLGLLPLCAAWGYLTPKLIDQFSRGNPRLVGKAYAANVLGCIVGPLAASYLFLPEMSCRNAMILLALPLGLFFLLSMKEKPARKGPAMGWALLSLALFALAFKAMDYEEGLRLLDPEAVVHRDYTATTVSVGSGMYKNLYVNGIGITGLVPPTKMMAHLPLALLSHKPQSVLDICFGMGTTFRSLMSWGLSTTAVDLVPSVFKAFPYYYSDAPAVLADPRGRLVADDGRRFLQRSGDRFDLITIDPPPPVEAAGSSLLYSTGFYAQAKKRLKKDGLLQQWIPAAEYKIVQAVGRSLALSFPYVRVFAYPYGAGYHFIASLSPIPGVSPREMARRMPDSARKDMVEWTPQESPENLFRFFLSREVDPKSLLNGDPRVVITDDQPYNEYFLLRRFAARGGPPSNP